MPSLYGILRLATRIKSQRIKLLGIWLFHLLGKRYIGIFLDPVLACNYRCKMCYFSDEEKRKSYRGTLSIEEMELIAKALFHRALKLQVGCGAEPTLHKDLTRVIRLGKDYGVPYISLTTNGSLIAQAQLVEMVQAGLNELTVSVHGLTKETYEMLMTNGKFEVFLQLLQAVSVVKKQYPALKLRVNYTINNDNLEELASFWNVFGGEVDIVQLRPIQKIGESEYKDFDLTKMHERYNAIIAPLVNECQQKGITCIAPEKEDLLRLEGREEDDRIAQATYCYVSARSCWQDDFDFRKDTFESYSQKHRLAGKLLGSVFARNKQRQVEVTRKLNYSINN